MDRKLFTDSRRLGIWGAAIIIACLASAQVAAGPPEPNERPPDEVTFRSDYAPLDVTGNQSGRFGYVHYNGPRTWDKDRREYFGNLVLFPEYLSSLLYTRPEVDRALPFRPLGEDYKIVFPPVRQDEIVPLFGDLYRVKEGISDDHPQRGGDNRVTFKQLSAKDRPEGVSFQTDSIPLLLQRNDRGSARLHNCSVMVTEVRAIEKTAPPSYTATVRIMGEGVPKSEATVKVGDVLLIHNRGHKVRAIVPRDEKTKVIGWVELDVLPIPEEKLVKDKTTFVRPLALPESGGGPKK